jgi:ribosome-associated protein
MRGHDDDSGEFLGPSRSQRKREAEGVFELAERLVAMTQAQLRPLPLPDTIADAIRDTQKISAPIARKRQLQYLAKLMRREDDELLDSLRASLEHDRAEIRRETAGLHRIEAWRERLLAEGDTAFSELVDEYPAVDRQRLRQLIRATHDERAKNRPPAAFRLIFQMLRELGIGNSEPGIDQAG